MLSHEGERIAWLSLEGEIDHDSATKFLKASVFHRYMSGTHTHTLRPFRRDPEGERIPLAQPRSEGERIQKEKKTREKNKEKEKRKGNKHEKQRKKKPGKGKKKQKKREKREKGKRNKKKKKRTSTTHNFKKKTHLKMPPIFLLPPTCL